MAKVKITETVLRDSHQSLAATRMTTEEMIPALELLDHTAVVGKSRATGDFNYFASLFQRIFHKGRAILHRFVYYTRLAKR